MLLTALARLSPGIGVDQLAFAARLTAAAPQATADLAAILTRASDTAGSPA